MRPQPGYELFAPKSAPNPTAAHDDSGKRRTIATRDSEVFVAVGTEIRWADLVLLKEGVTSYRSLKVAVPLPITNLVLSPNNDYLAIATSHTVHVALLPDSSLLESGDSSPLKLKTFQVGPTAHVREESPVASVLWHPLGYHGRCLVTITKEGVVRLWEVNRSDRSTFSEPALSIDLKKLANATSDEEDLSASKYGASKGFSPDSVELEVASACFGDFPDQEGVHGWAPMTLWIAMVEGSIYALCPLLPSKWQLQESAGASTVLETLATSINADFADVEDEPGPPSQDAEITSRQLSWLSDILYAEPFHEELPNGDSIRVFARPSSVPACPLLQGPFSISPADVEDFEISDIIVFSLKNYSDSTDEEPAEGLPAIVVCLLTDTSQIHICLDLLGIVGRWLPSAQYQDNLIESIEHTLIVAETIALAKDETSTFSQSITPDIQTDFSFFVSHASGVFYISLEKWVRKLENELAEPQSEGIEFRLSRLLESATTQADLCISRTSRTTASQSVSATEVTSCVVISDGNIGYFVLTSFENEPYAVTLDAPEEGPTEEELAEYMDVPALPSQIRPAYQAPKELYEPLQFMIGMDKLVPARHKASTKEEIRLSPANLDILMNAHKALSQDTHKLQTAVSDLFIRCERLRDEFRDQVFRAAQLVSKIDSATGNDEDVAGSNSDVYGAAKIEERLDKVKAKQEQINARYEAIRRKMANIGGAELSEKEAAFLNNLQLMDGALDRQAQTLTDDPDGSEVPAWQRLEKVKGLQKDLTKQVDQLSKAGKEERAASGVKVPSHSRKQENEQIEALLQRETALVEAATNRLRSMGISIPLEGGN